MLELNTWIILNHYTYIHIYIIHTRSGKFMEVDLIHFLVRYELLNLLSLGNATPIHLYGDNHPKIAFIRSLDFPMVSAAESRSDQKRLPIQVPPSQGLQQSASAPSLRWVATASVHPAWTVNSDYCTMSGWWFGTCFFHNIWDNPSHWLIFFKMIKTTNQMGWTFYTYSSRGNIPIFRKSSHTMFSSRPGFWYVTLIGISAQSGGNS